MYSNKHLSLNQTACQIWPQETWTPPRRQTGSKTPSWKLKFDRQTMSYVPSKKHGFIGTCSRQVHEQITFLN
jgi:hypothetical protein